MCAAAGQASSEDVASELMFVFEGAQLAAQNQSIAGGGAHALRIAGEILERQATAK